jgi:hypothetical protein
LGTADDISPADGREVLTFEQAMRAATGANAAAPVGRLTVQGALDVYLTALASRSKYADDDRDGMDTALPPGIAGLGNKARGPSRTERHQRAKVEFRPPLEERRARNECYDIWIGCCKASVPDVLGRRTNW